MWVRENRTKGARARLRFFEPRAAGQAAQRIPVVRRSVAFFDYFPFLASSRKYAIGMAFNFKDFFMLDMIKFASKKVF